MIDITDQITALTVGEWQTVRIPLMAFADQDVAFDQNNQPLLVSSDAPLTLRLNNIHYSLAGGEIGCN